MCIRDSDLHEAVDIAVTSGGNIFAPFDCKIDSYDSDTKTVILWKNDVQYWYCLLYTSVPYNTLSGEVRAAISDLAVLQYEVLKKVGDAVRCV